MGSLLGAGVVNRLCTRYLLLCAAVSVLEGGIRAAHTIEMRPPLRFTQHPFGGWVPPSPAVCALDSLIALRIAPVWSDTASGLMRANAGHELRLKCAK